MKIRTIAPFIVFASALVVLNSVASQNPQLQWVKSLPDGSVVIQVAGEAGQRRAFTEEQVDRIALNKRHLDETKADLETCRGKLDQTQADLQKEKNNVQDERVKYARIKQDFADQGALLDQSIRLNKQGGKVSGFLNWWPVRVTTEGIIPAVQIARCK